jgi:hypothetical protein
MTSMDGGLLSNNTTPRRDPSQRILADMDGASHWKTMRSHRWSVALALVAPCALVAASMFLLSSEEIPAIRLSPLVAASLPTVTFQPFALVAPVVVAPVRIESPRMATPVGKIKILKARKRWAAASPSVDVAVLSVLVEHIDAERRRASLNSQADRRRPLK